MSKYAIHFSDENTYFIADDQPATSDVAKALTFDSHEEARKECKIVNGTWMLPGREINGEWVLECPATVVEVE